MTRNLAHRRFWKRIVICLFAVSVAWSTALGGDDPPSAGQLERDLRKAYLAADYKKALEAAEKLHELDPDRADMMYNMACLHCLLGHKDKAYEWLEKSVDAGYDNVAHVRVDSDLRTIHGEDRFRALLRKMENGDRDEKPARTERPQPESREKPAPPQIQAQRVQRIGQLTQQLIEAAEKGEKDKALKLAMEAHELAEKVGSPGQKSLTKYNVACMNALMGKKDAALDYLEQSVEAGGFARDMAAQIEGDSDLDSLRESPRYKKILDKARANSEVTSVKFQWKVTTPKGYDKSKKAPLIVALHSYGGDMNETTRVWKAAAQEIGAVLLTPQGTVPLEGEKLHWGRDIDLAELNVMQAVEDTMDEYNIDENHVVLAGFSQGGWLTWAIGLRNPEAFCGLIPVCGNFSKECEENLDSDELENLRVFAMIGEEERKELLDSNRRAEKRLSSAGVKVQTKVYKGVGHAYPDEADEELVKALRFVMEK